MGVGQAEHRVVDMVDFMLALMLADAGDEIQGIKRGMLECIDMAAVNKCDGENRLRGERAAVDLRAGVEPSACAARRPSRGGDPQCSGGCGCR